MKGFTWGASIFHNLAFFRNCTTICDEINQVFFIFSNFQVAFLVVVSEWSNWEFATQLSTTRSWSRQRFRDAILECWVVPTFGTTQHQGNLGNWKGNAFEDPNHSPCHCCSRLQDLSLLGRPLQRIVIIDNSPTSFLFQPRNSIQCTSWFDDMTDTELMDLLPVLEDLAVCNDCPLASMNLCQMQFS